MLSFTTPLYTALGALVALKIGFTPTWTSNVGSDLNLVGGLLERFSEGAVPGMASRSTG